MTTPELLSTLAQYHAGLEAEMALLHRLEALSALQRERSLSRDFSSASDVSDARDRVMASLVAIEHELKPVRLMLVERHHELEGVPEFDAVRTLHRDAAELVARIVSSDRESLEALKDAEQARRLAADTVERGETTLAAYRRVIAPPLANATLVNRRG